jgi:predicted amidohydrolase
MNDLWVACGQFVAEPGNKERNVARMLGYARQARDRGCSLILFPELIVTGYLPPQQVRPLAESLNGPSVVTLAQGAREIGIAIAFGIAELDEGKKVRYNSLVIISDSGQLTAVYHKIHLWDSEKEWAQGGTQVPLFVYAGARWSGWICYDTRFPEVARLATLQGAEICLVPTAWLGPGEEWELALRARALDNSVFCLGADIINPEPALRCHGLSMVVGPRGEVLARAEPSREGIICARLQARTLYDQRVRVRLLNNRRPELYGALGETPCLL